MLGLMPGFFIEFIHFRVINEVIIELIVLIDSSIGIWILFSNPTSTLVGFQQVTLGVLLCCSKHCCKIGMLALMGAQAVCR